MLQRFITNFNVRLVTVIQQQEVGIEPIINYWAALTKWWCAR